MPCLFVCTDLKKSLFSVDGLQCIVHPVSEMQSFNAKILSFAEPEYLERRRHLLVKLNYSDLLDPGRSTHCFHQLIKQKQN